MSKNVKIKIFSKPGPGIKFPLTRITSFAYARLMNT